ncbi:MAG: hypothetical protein PSU94_08075 [Lacunisphaera sp.]|nr:hypothetical protein [Lacunisphaera sp.]
MSPSSKTVPEVFIVESVDEDDEEANRYDGRRLYETLCLHPGRLPRYYYIRTKQELREMARLFVQSNYRWLHFSCHGNRREFGLRLDPLSFPEFARIFDGRLNDRRLFVSACKVGVEGLADAVFTRNPDCYSIVAPSHGPRFTESAVFWTAFYHLMRKRRRTVMRHEDISEVLDKLAGVFPPRMNYFKFNKKNHALLIA